MVRLPWHAFRKFDRFERRIRKYLRDVDKYLDKVEKSKRVTKATLKKLRKIFTELLKYLEETEDIILLDMGEIAERWCEDEEYEDERHENFCEELRGWVVAMDDLSKEIERHKDRVRKLLEKLSGITVTRKLR